ncbi:MBOAT family O-acyltransferase [Porcipelethomonas sp.]|uniref:MBOAT family O-acyltransferase n=1 Tax=Porcipelethomonas sp. TaxID=2981675 RepID=UPI003EF67699
MVFSSIVFIYFFLPVILLIYYAVPKQIKNIILLASGLLFYAWGEPVYVFLMLFTTAVDYTAGRIIDRFDANDKIRRAALITSLVINLGILFTFKYSGFAAGIIGLKIKELPLPIGISFYTFQSMSYTIDMYMRKIKVQKNFINYAAYVTLFPQIVAGPIVRYEDVQNEINERKINGVMFGEGAEIFIRGLGKKVLLANNIGLLWTEIKSMDYSGISAVTAWLGILAFTFQIYYDFSGYSDMAVGLGKMLGFNFPENFRHPYISRSISEFWRRWHITLGSWFRSYVYIPLGGNRKGKAKTLRNLLIVWGLTGLWHGASWNFILWGIYFGVLIIIEKFFLGKYLEKINPFFSILYTFVLVVFGWVLFDTASLTDALYYFKAMFCGNGTFIDSQALFQLKNYIVLFVLCVFFSGELPGKIIKKLKEKSSVSKIIDVSAPFVQICIMLICTAYLVDASYNPFLYFRF